LGAPFFSAPGCGEREGLGVSVGLGLSSGVAVGVEDAFLRFDFVVAVGDGVGETFLCFGEAVGDGLGVGFFVERFRCLRGGGVGVAKIFLIFVPNDSSAAFVLWTAPNKIAAIRSHFMNMIVFKQIGGWSKIQNSNLEIQNKRIQNTEMIRTVVAKALCRRVG
jgi:hypothetical protein